MKRILSLGMVARVAIFLVVVIIVMSVSLLVQAHDAPEATTLQAANAVPGAPKIEELAMSDVSDGLASWYGADFHGRRTASGERYDMNAFTAAHKSLPFGTLLRVVNEETGKVVLVEVTDRGPFVRRRVVDLSRAAAREIGVSVSPVVVDAIRVDEIAGFYGANDSTVMVFSDDLKPLAIDKSLVREVFKARSLTEVMRNRTDGSKVLVRLDERNRPIFSLVEIDTVL